MTNEFKSKVKAKVKESFFHVLKRHRTELFRLLPIIAVSIFFFTADVVATGPLFLAISFVVAFAGISHLLRRILFPYIDMGQLFEAAKWNPLSAAIIFLSITLFLIALLVCSVAILVA